MKAKIAIVSPISYIEQEINKIIVQEFNQIFIDIAPKIQEDIKNNLSPLFANSDTFKEMTTELSNLNVEIGIPANEAKAKWLGIFDILTNQVFIEIDKMRATGKQISGGILCNIIKTDFKDIVESSFGQYITEKGYLLPWQRWLLLDGDNIVISDHHVKLVNPLKPSKYFFSRTGGAIMSKRGSWKVPAGHSGTQDDNWITRIIDTYLNEIDKFVYQSFKTRLKNAI